MVDLDELLNDFQERLFRVTPSDVRADIRARFEEVGAVKVLWRSPVGTVLGAAVATLEGQAADLQFLHILPRHATARRSGEILDEVLAGLPSGTSKVRAMGSSGGRWLHLVPGEAREVLLARRFSAYDRVLVTRDLEAPVAPPPPLREGYTLDHPDPARVEEWADFAYRAYEGTTDFGIIALDATPPAYERLYRRFLSGEFGGYDRAQSIVARAPGGEPAGVLHTIVLGKEPYVGDLSVLPGHRGTGLGRALLLTALERYRAAGFRRAALTVTAQNTPAYNLYRSAGFEVQRSSELYFRFA